MQDIVNAIMQQYYQTFPEKITALGGGFYGRVFRVDFAVAPFTAVIKIYLFPGLAQKEAQQLRILSTHARVKMPEVFFVHAQTLQAPKDALIMEYIEGVNAGHPDITLTDGNRALIAETIVDNLIAYHQTVNWDGFGEIGAKSFEPDWTAYYRPEAVHIFEKGKCMCDDGRIDWDTLSVMDCALERFDRIFSVPIREARLIHGDYNTWNVMLNPALTHVQAVIDPFHCRWADSEMDLYQLDNANGAYYGLMRRYEAKVKLSENFHVKNCFYELFTEIMHFYDANIDTKQSRLPQAALALKRRMNRYGIC